MAVLSKQEFKDKWGGKFADNTIQNVDEAMLREFRQDIADTFANVAAISAPTAPDYDAGAIYANGAVVLFGLPNKLFYQAKLPGLLPAPTPGVETTEWLPVARPLSPLLPYRELSAQQGRDCARDGLLEPSMLYRFTDRVAANGDPLDDVLVAAVSRHSVAGADAYAIGIDPQTREEYLLAVSYELATDTTAPRAAGAGGTGNGYSKDETDALLADKASRQDVADIVGAAPAALDTLAEIADQLEADEVGAAAMLARIQQHTLQLNTLAVNTSPVFGYLETGGAPVGYASLAEALADARPKTFMRFNQAVMPLARSNDPLNPGWASYVDGEGATLELGNNVVLSLPGSNVGTLLLKNFFVFQAAGTRGGRIRLLATGNNTTPPGQLPRLDGQYSVPVELSGGTYAFTGTFGSLLGTGTAHLFEPYDVAYVAPGVTVVEHQGGAGSGTGYTDQQAALAAAQLLLAATKVGLRISQDAQGKLTIVADVYGRLFFTSPRPGTGNLVRANFSLTPPEEATYAWAADSNVDRVEMSSAGNLFSGTLAQFKTLTLSLLSGQDYYVVLTPIDVNAPAFLALKRI